MVEKFALIVPTLNEEANIGVLLDRVCSNLDHLDVECEILVVDDESKDGTRQVVKQRMLSDPRIRLLTRRGARGLSGAVLFGWRHTDAEILGVIDADLQHPPELLSALIREVLHGKDMAVGSRYVAGDGTAGWNPVRKALSLMSTWITYPLQKKEIRVRDPLSGFFVLRRSCIEALELQPQGFKLLLEILVRGRIRSVTEVPYQFGLRHAGTSKANLRVGLNYLQLIGRLSLNSFSKTGPS